SMLLLYVLAVLVALVAGWRTWRRLRYFLHVFQLEGYKLNEYGPWLGRRLGSVVVAPSHAVGLAVLLLVALLGNAGWGVGLGLFAWTLAFASARRYDSRREKKPLAFTD